MSITTLLVIVISPFRSEENGHGEVLELARFLLLVNNRNETRIQI